MEYPENFETPANPAGKGIAVSRTMAILSCILFLGIIFLCGFILWSSRSERLMPYMISIDNTNGDWVIVGKTNFNSTEFTSAYTIQESIVNRFTQNWFTISPNNDENNAAWEKCDNATCIEKNTSAHNMRNCTISCNTSDELYTRFVYEILPEYNERINDGETWTVDEKSIVISPSGNISELGGTWRVMATVISNIHNEFDVKIFIKIAKKQNYHSTTMGFYIADFNAYRI